MTKNLKIAIIGLGVVGKAIHEYFEGKAEIAVYDINDGTFNSEAQKEIVNKCDFAFICVPTPRKEDDSCDTSIVEEVVSWLRTPLIIIKSTIEPGTTNILKEKYNKKIIFSPEYTSESKYYNPIMRKIEHHPFIILGGTEEEVGMIKDTFVEISGPLVEIFSCSAKEAELIKYFENTFFAVKVGFSNEMREICERAGVDYHKVRYGWLLDPRINKMHTLAFKSSRGYSGKCVPKDRAAINAWCKKKLNYKPPIIDAAGEWDLDKKKT